MDITSYILSKKYVEDTLVGMGALAGKSAFDIACENGFKGTPTEWLASLKGDTPQIGPSGTWVINGVDTGILASPSIAGYATEEFVQLKIAEAQLGGDVDLSAYYTKSEIDKKLNEIELPVPDLTNYATKVEVQKMIDAIEIPEENVTMIALTDEEILAICK